MNKNEQHILEGPIVSTIIRLALPIATLSIMGFLYNIINMMFIGHSGGTDMAAAIGAGALISSIWFALMNLSRVGAQVKVAQSLGEKSSTHAKNFAKASVHLAAISAIVITLFSILFARELIMLAGISEAKIVNYGQAYLTISALGILPLFLSSIMTGNLNGQGDTKATLYFNGIGLFVNIVLDYVLIVVFQQGIVGAAIATIIAQYATFICTYFYWRRKESLFHDVKLFQLGEVAEMFQIARLGLPNTANRLLFVLFSVLIAHEIHMFGDKMIGIQRIGIQVESITWMMSFGIAQAFSTFVGQNFGAKNINRVREAYRRLMYIMIPYGIVVSLLMFVFAEPIFNLFLPKDAEGFQVGVTYLKILSASQLFMVLEIVTTGGFEGLGRTLIPAIISIVFTGLRVPMSHFAIKAGSGLDGVWWSISLSSIIKGLLAFVIFIIILYRFRIRMSSEGNEQLAVA